MSSIYNWDFSEINSTRLKIQKNIKIYIKIYWESIYDQKWLYNDQMSQNENTNEFSLVV